MPQHDMVIDNADGLTVRTDFNAAMQALISCSSGPVQPPVMFAGQLWLDTSVPPDGILRQRNQANNAWLPVLLPPDFRFPEADLYFGARTDPNRFVWNDKFDGSGTDIAVLSETGVMTLAGTPTSAGDVPTRGYVDQIAQPVGSVMYYPSATAPINWLKCNGASLIRDSYDPLFQIIGTTFGAANSSHFSLPDLRGEFMRGWDDARGIDAGRVLGSAQASDFASHNHPVTVGLNSANHAHTFSDTSSSTSSAGAHTHTITVGAGDGGLANTIGTAGTSATGGGTDSTNSAGAHTHTVAVSGTTGLQNANHTHAVTITAAGGADTRPRNVALLACIKYQ